MKIRTDVHLGVLERKGLLFIVLAVAELGPEDQLGEAFGHSLLVGATLHPRLLEARVWSYSNRVSSRRQNTPDWRKCISRCSGSRTVLDTILDLKAFAILCQGK